MKRFLASLGLLAVIPFFMSRRSRVVRTLRIDVPPAGVFPFIEDLRNWPLWTQGNRRERVIRRYEGSGAGAVQHWATACSEGTVRIIACVPDRSVSYVLDTKDGECRRGAGVSLPPLPVQRREASATLEGVITLEAVGEGTRVTWAGWWLGGANPYLRYLDLVLRFWTGRDFTAGLRNLKRLAEACQQQEVL